MYSVARSAIQGAAVPHKNVETNHGLWCCGVVVLNYPITSRLDSMFPNYPKSWLRHVIAMVKEHRVVNWCQLVFNEFNTDLACR